MKLYNKFLSLEGGYLWFQLRIYYKINHSTWKAVVIHQLQDALHPVGEFNGLQKR